MLTLFTFTRRLQLLRQRKLLVPLLFQFLRRRRDVALRRDVVVEHSYLWDSFGDVLEAFSRGVVICSVSFISGG